MTDTDRALLVDHYRAFMLRLGVAILRRLMRREAGLPTRDSVHTREIELTVDAERLAARIEPPPG